jgi:hypothetical protein
MLTATLVVLGLAPVGASSANISHSFNSTDEVRIGSLVSLDSKQSDYVSLANSSNASKLLGVAVASNDSLLAVDAEEGKVQIATSGVANALASTLNGNIAVGDQIAVSPFDGVGMKASAGSKILGLAQTALNAGTDGVTTQSVTDKHGKTRQIIVGYVRINIGIGTATQGVDANLNSLQRLVRSITGHTVSAARAFISLAVAIVASLALITLIYASIYGSIVSIGRNPLAKYAVFRSLTSVLIMAVLTAGVASLTIFFLLR